MDQKEIQQALDNQRRFFASGKTLEVKFRLEILRKLRSLILLHEMEIQEALWKDFHKPAFEVIATETRLVLKELNFAIRKLSKWSDSKRVRTPIVHFLSFSYIIPQPYGQVLILSPWNYPFQLAFIPVIGALAAGNCVVLKTSRQVPASNAVIEKILGMLSKDVAIMTNGDHTISEYLLSYKFDYIFFTGSSNIGKYVMQKAAENLIPVSLELGGKNPCVVASDANMEYAAKRIVWGKFLNAGQTCICTDYVLVDNKIKDKFLDYIKLEIKAFYGENPEQSKDFARIINSTNLQRLAKLMKTGEIVTGGNMNAESCFLEPTVIKNIHPRDPIMQEEVFGPVLPVLGYDSFNEVYNIISGYPKPLAVYIFSVNKKLIKEFLLKTQSGTAGINDTVMQIASPYLPYGGVGNSGMGRYHGRKSFETFSNMRSVLVKSNLFDIPLRYPPYTKFREKVLSFLLK